MKGLLGIAWGGEERRMFSLLLNPSVLSHHMARGSPVHATFEFTVPGPKPSRPSTSLFRSFLMSERAMPWSLPEERLIETYLSRYAYSKGALND